MHGAHANNEGWRIPAKAMEDTVMVPLLDLLRNLSRLMDVMSLKDPNINALTKLKAQAMSLADQLEESKPQDKRKILQIVINRVDLGPKSIKLILDKSELPEVLRVPCPDDLSPVSINVPVRMQHRGVETKLIIDGPNANTRNVDADLCRLIAQAHHWFDQLTSGEATTVREIAAREQMNEHEITRVLPSRISFAPNSRGYSRRAASGGGECLSAQASLFHTVRLDSAGRFT
jgi:hypothetical protein